jgi:hypothetical protein
LIRVQNHIAQNIPKSPTQMAKLPFVKHIIHALIFSFTILGFSSCSREILAPFQDNTATGPVIQCILNTDSVQNLLYSKVVKIDENFAPISDATIDLVIHNKNRFSFSSNQPGVYKIEPCILYPRDSFSVFFISPTDTFSVTDAMPSTIAFTKTDTFTQAIAGIGTTQNFMIQIKDSAIDENYYKISAKREVKKYIYNNSNQIADSTITWESLKIDGNEIPFQRNNYNNYTDYEILFSDETFNGVLSSLEFYNLLPFSNSKSEKTLSVTITLDNLTKALFDYYNSRAAHLWNQKSITQLPGPVESNIPKGYGVIGGKTQASWNIKYPN